MSVDEDRLTLRMVLGPGKGARARVKVEVACSPKASDQAMAEIEACLPAKAILALPFGTYRFDVGAHEGFRIVEHPTGSPSATLGEVEAALFPVLRRLYVRLAALHDAMADTAAIQEAVDGMYATAMNVVVEAREVAMLRPGFLATEVGTNVSVFVPLYEKGLDPTTIEFSEPFGYHVIPVDGTRFVAVVGVCPDEHPFASYAVAQFARLFETVARTREREAVRSSQRTLEEELAELMDDRRLLAAAFGELPPEERANMAGYAEEVRRLSGTAGEA